MSLLFKSSEVISNLRKAEGNLSAYPMAFGYAWGLLTDKQRKEMIKFAEETLAEKEANNGK